LVFGCGQHVALFAKLLSERDKTRTQAFARGISCLADIGQHAPKFSDALGHHVTLNDQLLDLGDLCLAALGKRVTATPDSATRLAVGRFFEEVLEKHPPPSMNHRPVRLYYITQAQSRPPTFVVSTNHEDGVHFSYQRYVVNQIRERFGFEGTPVRVRYRGKAKRDPAGKTQSQS